MREQSTRRRYDQSFINDSLALARRGDRSPRAVAEALGIPSSTFVAWYNADMAKQKRNAPSNDAPGVKPKRETAEQRIARLERELASKERELVLSHKRIDSLEMDREILKKAAAFFAKESK
jgi:transposase-like protein